MQMVCPCCDQYQPISVRPRISIDVETFAIEKREKKILLKKLEEIVEKNRKNRAKRN